MSVPEIHRVILYQLMPISVIEKVCSDCLEKRFISIHVLVCLIDHCLDFVRFDLRQIVVLGQIWTQSVVGTRLHGVLEDLVDSCNITGIIVIIIIIIIIIIITIIIIIITISLSSSSLSSPSS